MKAKRICIKFLAIVFSIILSVQIFNLGLVTFASEIRKEAEAVETTYAPENYEHKIKNEETGLRDRFTKTFACDDGTHTSVVYANPVHFKNSSGEWVPYDNTLKISEDETSYSPASSNIDIKLPVSISGKSSISISKAGFPFRMQIQSANAEAKAVVNNNYASQDENTDGLSETEINNLKKVSLKNQTSEIKYVNVFDNTDFEYILSSSCLKENIIINSRESNCSYSFRIDFGDLVPVQKESGAICFLNPDTNKSVYIIEKPYMYDAKGEYCDSVAMNLNGNILTVSADEDWINSSERAFPVVIDPSVSISSTSMIDSYVSAAYKTANNGTKDLIYGGNGTFLRRAYIKFSLPTLPDNAVITNATFSIVQKSCSGSFSSDCNYVRLFDLTGKSSWTETGITWNNQPLSTTKNGPQTNGTAVAASLQGSSLTNRTYSFNVTDTVKKWYRSNNNNGFMISTNNETKSVQPCFYSRENSSHEPYASINYTNNIGLEDQWTYQSVDMCESGTAYVNSNNGSLVYAHDDVSTSGLLFPVDITHIYLNNNDTYSSGSYGNMKFGKGFRLNILERISSNKYTDADGTIHNLNTSLTDNYLHLEYDTTTVVENTSSGSRMTYADGTVKEFNSNGYLVSVTDSNSNQVNINYSSDRITSVTDGAGYTISFAYNSDNYLSSVTDPAGRVTSYSYDSNGYLSQITYPDSTTTSFTYSSSNLYEIKNAANAKWRFAYSNLSYSSNSYSTVSSVTAYGENNSSSYADMVSFTYNGGTSVISNNHNDSVTLEFDAYGRTTAYSSKGNASKIMYNTTTNNLNNKVSAKSAGFKVTENLIEKSKQSVDTWSGSYQNITTSNSSDKVCYLKRSVKFTGNYGNGSDRLSGIAVTAGNTYTASVNVNISGALSSGKIYLRLTSGSVVECGPEYVSTGDGWAMISCSITIPAGESYLSAELVFENVTGDVYADVAQLTEGSSASMYNLVPDPLFRTVTPWTCSSSDYCSFSDETVRITGSLLQSVNVSQTFSAKGSANESFVFGLQSKTSAIDLGSGPFYGIKVVFISSGTDVCTRNIMLDYNHKNQWQQVLMPVTSTSDFDSVRIELHFDTQVGYAWYKDIFMYKNCAFGASYSYNTDGNVTGITDGADNSVSIAYSGADITGVTKSDGNTVVSDADYTYDNHHNILTATDTQSGIVTSYTYPSNNKGMPVSVCISDSSGTNSSSTSYTYSSDGNYLTSVTDASGATTAYTYDAAKGLVTSVTDGNGNITNYSYNAYNDLLVSVSNPDTSLGNAHTDYSYDSSERLTGISNGDITYGFNYDIYGRKDSVTSSSNILSDLTYNSDSTVSRTDYADGTYAEYSYDDKDRVTSVSYDGTEVYTYKYTDNDAIYQVYDADNDRTTKYQYDSLGRVTGISDSNSDNVVYGYDNLNRLSQMVTVSSNVILDTQTFLYDNQNRITSSSHSSTGSSESYTYDSLSRTSGVTNTFGSNTVSNGYTYVTNGTNQTGYVGSVSYTRTVSGTASSLSPTLSYEYDDNGNITDIYENGTLKYHYEYDSLNRLVKEDNISSHYTTIYTYDAGGDILSKQKYYTTNGTPGTAIGSSSYSYNDSRWPNGVTGYNGESIVYDANGNPTSYRGYTMTWDKGRFLETASKTGQSISYKYDFNGIRTEKTVNGTKTEYFYVGSVLISQKTGSEEIDFSYDASGRPYALKYNGTVYYYLLNLQGDVIGIYDSNGNIVVSYKYDAWGKLLEITGSLSDTVGEKNPLRYRGYYYDTETNLYYLQSRYYDPETCRFISADSLLVAGDAISGTNMFAYCLNNPVMYEDPSGEEANPALVDIMAVFLTAAYLVESLSVDVAIEVAEQLANSDLSGVNLVQTAKKDTDKWVKRKDKRKGSEERQKTGERERNVGHPDAEEHSRKAKGTGGVRKATTLIAVVGIAIVVADDVMGIGTLDDFALPVLVSLAAA